MTYAIVKTGGSQTKVSVDDVIVTNRIKDGKNIVADGTKINLDAVLFVDDKKIITDAAKLAKVKVEAEVLNQERGTKINAMKFKNKTRYRKRWGHRQELTRLRITGISAA